eukprot:TRINITY_DN3458_c3_g1_i2.p1 TRINITY_DN3458_c3_g1~~TRINITY_DN3458_c3_g1_i2.p1  ORF type:complete len:516 (+),score=69.84 TRINITY_DN3458_c3_g1_i2:61-1608(+)
MVRASDETVVAVPEASAPPVLCMACDSNIATSMCRACRDTGLSGLLCNSDQCFDMVHAFPPMAMAHRNKVHHISEEHKLEMCNAHGQPAYLVCREAGCASALLCIRCITSNTHKGHHYEDVTDMFEPTKAMLQERFNPVKAQLDAALSRKQQNCTGLEQVAACSQQWQDRLCLVFSVAKLVGREELERDGFAEQENTCRTMLGALESSVRHTYTSGVAALRKAEDVCRQEITLEHDLHHEHHLQMHRGGLENLALQSYIDGRNELVGRFQAALGLAEDMPRTLLRRSQDLQDWPTEGTVPECTVDAATMHVHLEQVVSADSKFTAPLGKGSCALSCSVPGCGEALSFYAALRCVSCDTLMCEACQATCHGCGGSLCRGCISECSGCPAKVCVGCFRECEGCLAILCLADCTKSCNDCTAVHCQACNTCSLCNGVRCTYCHPTCCHDEAPPIPPPATCQVCNVSRGDTVVCSMCKMKTCNTCLAMPTGRCKKNHCCDCQPECRMCTGRARPRGRRG